MLNEEFIDSIKHLFFQNGFTLSHIDRAEWQETGDRHLFSKLNPNWIGRKLGLDQKVQPQKKVDKSRTYLAEFILDGIHKFSLEIDETKIVTVTSRPKRGVFYDKDVDELVRPNPRKLEFMVWEYILAEFITMRTVIEDFKRTGLEAIRPKKEEAKA